MSKLFVFKYGGNAMTNETIKQQLLENICALKKLGHRIILVHGGGPFIEEALQIAQIKSEFIDGQRVTSPEALVHVEMALKGKVNSNLVGLVNKMGHSAIGLSGKDGKLVVAKKRFGQRSVNGQIKKIDLGQVGDVNTVQSDLLHLLMNSDYLPVLTCIAADEHGQAFNINGDIFAAHIAGATEATEFIILTDVDGLLKDINDPTSLIDEISISEINTLIQNGIVKGGMLPKLEACEIALKKGADQVRIINGTKPQQLLDLVNQQKKVGTVIKS